MSTFIETLEKYFPTQSCPKVLETVQKEGIKLSFVPSKKTFRGRYTCKTDEFSVPTIKICVIGGKYNQLFTFIHEIAHHFVWQKTRVNHGHDIVWQSFFEKIMADWLRFFPKEVADKIFDEFTIGHISATGIEVEDVLDKYDFPNKAVNPVFDDGFVTVSSLPVGAIFKSRNRYFEKSYLMRKNYVCYELPWRIKWSFGGGCRVEKATESDVPKQRITIRTMEAENGQLIEKSRETVEI